jgi:hypothetical protein
LISLAANNKPNYANNGASRLMNRPSVSGASLEVCPYEDEIKEEYKEERKKES